MSPNREDPMADLELRDLLDRAIGSQPAQPSPPDDLDRARRAVRHARSAAAARGGLVVGGLGLAALVAWPGSLGGMSRSLDARDAPAYASLESSTYVAAPSSPAATEYQPEELTESEALARCNDVVYADGSPDGLSVITYQQPIYAGDVVEVTGGEVAALGEPGPTAISCTVPGAWAGASPSTPVDAGDVDAILLECSDKLGIDLRDWTVAAAMDDGDGGIAAALLSPGQGYVASCEIGGAWDYEARIDNHRTPVEIHSTPLDDGGGMLDANSDPTGGSYSWAGVLPMGVESATIWYADGTEDPLPVGMHATYAIRVLRPGEAPPILRGFSAAGTPVLERDLGAGVGLR